MLRFLLASFLAFFFASSFAFAADLVATKTGDKITITRQGETEPIVTQNARADFRPYLHPIVSPDGKGELTEYSPGHHKHQTGLYWGFTRVNGRDYFHHPEGDYWKRASFDIIQAKGHEVSWRTVYDMLDADGKPVLRETQTWSMHEHDGEYMLELEWKMKKRSIFAFGTHRSAYK